MFEMFWNWINPKPKCVWTKWATVSDNGQPGTLHWTRQNRTCENCGKLQSRGIWGDGQGNDGPRNTNDDCITICRTNKTNN